MCVFMHVHPHSSVTEEFSFNVNNWDKKVQSKFKGKNSSPHMNHSVYACACMEGKVSDRYLREKKRISMIVTINEPFCGDCVVQPNWTIML